MTYTVLRIRHGEDMQERTYVPHQCRARAGAGTGAPGFCRRDSRKTFRGDISAGLPLPGVCLAQLSATGTAGRKSRLNSATPCGADQSAASTSPAAGSVAERFRGRRSIRRTGQGEEPWVRGARHSASFFATSRTAFICTNCGKHINCLCRQSHLVWSSTT